MHKRKVLTSVLMLCAGLAVSTLAAQAASVSYDSALSAPGFYNGTGGVNNGFTIVTDNGVEIGLRAMLRQNPADIATPGSSVYYVPLGMQTNVTSGGNGANASRAAWNFDLSINTQPGNGSMTSNGGLLLSDITANLTITGGPGSPLSFNPLTFFPDNAGWGTSGKVNLAGGVGSGNWGAQNSQNALFLGFDPNANATYTMKLDLYGANQQLLASDMIYVVAGEGNPDVQLPGTPAAVPVPAAAWTGMSMLAGMGGIATFRRRRVKLA